MIPVKLRRASMADCAFLLELRNDEEVRRSSFHTDPVTREEHEAWLRHVLADPERQLFIAENMEDDEPVGQIRLDMEGERGYEISYSVVPRCRGQKIGTIMIGTLMRHLTSPAGDVRVFARVKPGNIASQRVFCHNGFCKVRETDEYLEYEKYVHEG